jgi:hypothetical protein
MTKLTLNLKGGTFSVSNPRRKKARKKKSARNKKTVHRVGDELLSRSERGVSALFSPETHETARRLGSLAARGGRFLGNRLGAAGSRMLGRAEDAMNRRGIGGREDDTIDVLLGKPVVILCNMLGDDDGRFPKIAFSGILIAFRERIPGTLDGVRRVYTVMHTVTVTKEMMAVGIGDNAWSKNMIEFMDENVESWSSDDHTIYISPSGN